MLMLNDGAKAQLEELSERVSRYDRKSLKLTRAILVLGIVATICAIIQHFLSPDISSLHLPLSLLKANQLSNETGIDAPTALFASGLSRVFSKLGPITHILGIMSFAAAGFYGLTKASISGTMGFLSFAFLLQAAPALPGLFAGEYAGLQYQNPALVSALADHDMSEPIDQGYITKAHTLDERYLLAQVAVLSEAHYPADFFKSVADELKTVPTWLFVPEFEAQYAIEMAAYGHPETPTVVKHANTLSFYDAIVTTLSQMAIGGLLVLGLGAIGLSVLRMSIRRRLNAIDELVGKRRPDSGYSASSHTRDRLSLPLDSEGNSIRRSDLVEVSFARDSEGNSIRQYVLVEKKDRI